ncbi:MAG: helix-turn-helix transcriptional regulator [Deltaproteobacteria bacterium]|nr:helix-turn-helix transcriptional regulator [Deltaproteobacteria bacterium]
MRTRAEVIATLEAKRHLAKAIPEVSLPTTPKGRTSDLLVLCDLPSVFAELPQLARRAAKSNVALVIFSLNKADMAQLADAFAFAARLNVTPFFAPDFATCRRMIVAREHNAIDKLIACASIRGSELVAWSCEPKQYIVRFGALPGVRDLSGIAQQKFTLDADGSRLHWPHGDIALDLDAIRYACDSVFRRQTDRIARERLRHYGKAIRALRKKHRLTQGDISGLTDRQLRRLEAGLVVPHTSSMEKLAAAHRMSLPDYLSALAELSRSP